MHTTKTKRYTQGSVLGNAAMVLLNVTPPSVIENLVSEIEEELTDEIIDEMKCPPTDLYSDEPDLIKPNQSGCLWSDQIEL